MTQEQQKICERCLKMLKTAFPSNVIKIIFNLKPDDKTGKMSYLTENFVKVICE